MKASSVTLYYADWCGPCKHFLPTWTQFENKMNIIGSNVKVNKYESATKEVSTANITGFPTVMIEKDGKKYQYKGSRTVNGLLDEVLDSRLLKGGSDVTRKYKKYKTKYMKLKMESN